MAGSMVHWNGRLLCAIDTETTGLDPYWHEIWQICILPLDSNFNPRRDIVPFYIDIKPECPERIKMEAFKLNRKSLLRALQTGFDPQKAIDLLQEWFDKLNLPVTKFNTPKNIIPLGQNFTFDKSFMVKWLGQDLYSTFFHYHYKDTMLAANYLNDRAAMHAEKVPYPKVGLTYLCNLLKVKRERSHDALQDCLATASVYRKLLMQGVVE
jgi:DNA polymerase III epsilon subunit-like protein